MDPICHTLTGAVLGETGLRRRTALGMPTLLIAANLPDVDVMSYLSGGLAALEFRRGWTHGILAVVVLPLALAAVMLAWDRAVRRRRRPGAEPARAGPLFFLSGIGVVSHYLLDFLNTYGVRFLMPFSERWFYGDALFIIDPWMWLVLGGGTLLSVRQRRRGAGAPGRPARLALAVAGVYVAVMLGAAAAGRRVVEEAIGVRAPLSRRVLMVAPVPVNPFRREVVIAAGGRYEFGALTWLPAPRFRPGLAWIDRGDVSPEARAAAGTAPVRRFLRWARFPFYVVAHAPGGTRVHVGDVRFTRDVRDSWAAVTVRLVERAD